MDPNTALGTGVFKVRIGDFILVAPLMAPAPAIVIADDNFPNPESSYY